MANKEVPDLIVADPLDGTELLPVVQGGNSRQTNTGNVAALLLIDEDSFTTNSATKAPSQQSTKAYIDANAKILLQTAVATTSGTSINVTGIPSGVRRITLALSEVSMSGGSLPVIQIGDSGGIETTGYLGSAMSINSGGGAGATLFTNGLGLDRSGSATSRLNGIITLALLDPATNKWALAATTADSVSAFVSTSSSSKSLSGELDRVRLTTIGGSDTFDSGSMSVSWEF